MVSDFSNRKDIRRAEKAAKLAEANRIAYVKRIMSDTAGREWMHKLLEDCCLFGEPFVRGSWDATSRNLGMQSVGKQIFSDVVVHCPTQYIQMMQEASQKELTNDRHDDERTSSGEPTGSPDADRRVEGSESGELDPFAEPGSEA